jgi:restriction endonuclease S subunit
MSNSRQVSGGRFDPFYHQDEFEKLEQALLGGKYGIEKLGTLLAQINYGASVKNEYADTGIPFLRISDLNRNEINVKEMKFLPENMQKDLGNAFVYENDFLISRSGTLGVVALATKEINGFAYGSFMIKFCLKQDAPVNKKFISYFLNSETMQKIVGKNKIGAIQGNITIPTIKNLQIPLPPLERQSEIADHISAIRAKAKQLQHEAKAELEQAKKTIEKMILGEQYE